MRLFPRRSTVGRVMALVFLVAVGLAVSRHVARSWGAGEVFAIAPMVLVATNVLAWFQGARRQVFWIGFGLAGWLYLTFALASPLAESLPTTWLLAALHDRLSLDQQRPDSDTDFGNGIMLAQANADSFRRAGHSLMSLAFALLGGVLALVIVPSKPTVDVLPPPDGSLLKPGWRVAASSSPDSETPRLEGDDR